MMTHHSEHVIQKQLANAMSDEQAVLLAYTEQGSDVFMVDASGQSIYDAAAQADETGVWVFLGHAINSDQVNYGQDWQQNPSVNHEMPDDIALGVPEKASQLSTGMKWLIGGLATAGIFALGAAMNDNHAPHHHDDRVPPPPIPQPNAVVQQFSSTHNPENPNEPAMVVQAEPPKPKMNATPSSDTVENTANTATEPTTIAVLTEPSVEPTVVNEPATLPEIALTPMKYTVPNMMTLPVDLFGNSVTATEQLG